MTETDATKGTGDGYHAPERNDTTDATTDHFRDATKKVRAMPKTCYTCIHWINEKGTSIGKCAHKEDWICTWHDSGNDCLKHEWCEMPKDGER